MGSAWELCSSGSRVAVNVALVFWSPMMLLRRSMTPVGCSTAHEVTTSYLLGVRQVDFGVVTLQVMSERFT